MKRFWMLLFWLVAASASAQLQVQSARWEVIGGGPWCDAGRQMADLCNGRRACQVYVDPRYLCGGDPAVGRAKTLNVTYTCNGRTQPTLAFADLSQASLRCDASNVNANPNNNGNHNGNNNGNNGNHNGHNGGNWNPPPPSVATGNERGKLQIYEARWEVIGGGAHCDATAQMVRACDGKSFCQMFVDPRYLCNGDPAPGQEKRLEIRYACDGERQQPVGFNDFSEAVLRCRRGAVGGPVTGPIYQPPVSRTGLSVHSARWEEVGGGSGCDATRQMVDLCNGRGACQVRVDPRYLCNGDPAPGRNKSLNISYSCNGRQQAQIAYPDFSQAALRCDGAVIQPPVEPRRGVVKIRSARWEQVGGGGWCDATVQMVQACDGKTRCRVKVDADSLCGGDPAPGHLKSLDVRYSCDGRNRDTASFPDFANAVISCE
jgi:hypothetical protein